MSETKAKFHLIPEEPKTDDAARAGMRMILVGLHALSQRALTAISDLFSLILVGAVWALAFHVLDGPSQQQIVTLFGFAGFCVLIDVIRRRNK